MTDMGTINAILGSIKTATDIAKLIKESGASLEKAEIKLQIAELIGSLADAKIEISNIQTMLANKDKEIERLKEKLKSVGSTVGFLGARYLVGENGEPVGTPFCPTCWATKKDLIPLTKWSNIDHTHKCGDCKNTVSSRHSPLDAQAYIDAQKQAASKLGTEYQVKTTQ